MTNPILDVRGVKVEITEGERTLFPVDGVSFSLAPGEALAIVGESGAGKSLTLRAILDLLPPNARRSAGEILFASTGPLSAVDPASRRGAGIALVFQEPMSALNPLLRVGDLIAGAYAATHRVSRAAARSQAVQLMKEVGIPAAEARMRLYPHQLSGGLRQRVMISMALATEPRVLLCDEPTTALDVTIQQQILDLVKRIRDERALALVYVTHDLAIVGDVCDRVAVMYAGRLIETGTVDEVFSAPRHPYTYALLRSVPAIDRAAADLVTIPGRAPDPRSFPRGCRFHPRCPLARADCLEASYELAPLGSGRATACIHHGEVEELDDARS